MEDNRFIRTLLLTVMLVEALDEIERTDGYRMKLKQLGNRFKGELEKYCSDVFSNMDKGLAHSSTELVARLTSEIDAMLEKHP